MNNSHVCANRMGVSNRIRNQLETRQDIIIRQISVLRADSIKFDTVAYSHGLSDSNQRA